ncbi:F-box/kelch-repeat protein At1g57790 [Linum grandiflorum]
MSFSAPPTSPHCVVFGIKNMYPNKARFKSCYERLLGSKVITNRCRFRPVPGKTSVIWSSLGSAPVFHKGAFYCLSQSGQLGVFDPSKKSNIWRMVDTSNDVPWRSHCDKVYLMESSRGELISVVVDDGSQGEFLLMFKFDEELKLWQNLGSLEDQVAFLSPTSCIVLPCKELQVNGLENTIHFPRFHGNCNVFYSLSTRRFHSFEGGYTGDDASDKELPMNSTWMMPVFRQYSSQQLDWKNKEDHCIRLVDPYYFIRGFKFSQPNIMGTSTSSTTTGAPKAKPRLILSHEENKDEHHHTFLDLVTNVSHSDDSMMELFRGKQVYGSSGNGLVLLVDSSESGIGDKCVLLNTTSMMVEQLPTLEMPRNFRREHCLIHQPSGSCETVVTIFGLIDTGEEYKAVTIFCRVGDKEWTRCTQGNISVLQAAAYQGKIYGVTVLARPIARLEFFEMEQQQTDYKVTILERFELPKDKHMGQMGFDVRMVESCGELLYFESFPQDISGTLNPTMDVRVHRVNLEGMRMEVVKNLGDRAFFFGHRVGGFGCCASKSGFEKNSIYFVTHSEGNVHKYDYGRHRISTVFSTLDEPKDCQMGEVVMFQ